VDPRNKACLRLLDKLGFQVVGYGEKTYKTHLGWCDSVYLEAMDRSRFDWSDIYVAAPGSDIRIS
jgi:RimJ/RimL family protein N-acetyltransferase